MPTLVIPSVFWQQAATLTSHYWQTPRGILFPERLARTPAAWLKPSVDRALQPKTLILADCFAKQWTQEKRTAIRAALDALMSRGFSIYAWQAGKFVLLSKTDLMAWEWGYGGDVYKAMTPMASHEIMRMAMKQLESPHDALHVVDHYWLDALLQGNAGPRVLRASELAGFKTAMRTQVIDQLLQEKPPLTQFIVDEFSYAAASAVRDLQARCPSLPNLITYQTLKLKQDDIGDFMTIGLFPLKVVTKQLGAIRTLGIKDVNTLKLVPFLENMPALRQLDVERSTVVSSTERFFSPSVSNLELISLDEVDFKPQLVLLDSGDEPLIDLVHLVLRSASPESPSVSVNEYILQNFLPLARKIRSLELMGVPLKGRVRLLKNSLPFLEMIDLSFCQIESSVFNSLLEAAPGLKSLLIYICSDATLNTLITHLVSQKTPLEMLRFRNDGLTGKQLRQILLSTSSTLTRLHLIGRKANWSGDFCPDDLPALKTLELFFSEMSCEQLVPILMAAKMLKKLVVHFPLNFPHVPHDLSDLTFDSNKITATCIQSALKSFKQLKSLHFRGVMTIIEPIYLPLGSQLSLEEIHLDSNCVQPMITFSQRNLQTLLMASPRLNLLRLNEVNLEQFCSFDMDDTHDFSLPPNQLMNLETVDLSGTITFTVEMLRTLLQAAPNLRVLNLGGCPQLAWETLDAKLQQQIKHIPFVSWVSDRPMSSVSNTTAPVRCASLGDAETQQTALQTFHCQGIFYPMGQQETPHVSTYRLNVFESLSVNPNPCTSQQVYQLQPSADLALCPCPEVVVSQGDVFSQGPMDDSVFYGKQTLMLTNKWQTLASLSPQEVMLTYHVSPECPVEIQYSLQDNLYYVRSRTPISTMVTLDYLVKVPSPEEVPPLPADIQALVDEFRSFQAGALESLPPQATGQDYLDAMIEQRKGACRHRAVAFKSLLDKKGIPARIVVNECHAYCEVNIGDKWLTCQLGGYPAIIEVNTSARPKRVQKSLSEAQPHPVEDELPAVFLEEPSLAELSFCQACFNEEDVLKRLIELPSTMDVNAMRWALQTYGETTHHPVFYIHSPDDLICAAPYIARQADNTGILQKGPGGALHRFLQGPHELPPVLIVNYETFHADDIVRFNALLDTERSADGTSLPTAARVIGLTNLNKPDAYRGSDFYSRFDAVGPCPLSSEELVEAIPVLPFSTLQEGETATFIPLHHATDWKERLLGHWVLNGKQLTYQEGALQAALASHKPIVIQNGLWEDATFCGFWQDACLRGYIEHAGRRLTLPVGGIRLIQQEGYDWASLTTALQIEPVLSDETHTVLNPTLLSLFLQRYTIESGDFVQQLGFIEAHKGGILPVHVTRALSDDEWGMLLTTCQDNGVTLQAYLEPGVPSPPTPSTPPVLNEFRPWSHEASVVQSTDVDTTVALLMAEHPEDWIVIDVSECHAEDLLIKLHGKLEEIADRLLFFQFHEESSEVLTDLMAGQRIILKGQVSDELADELAPLLIKRATSPDASGRLVLISPDTHALPSGQVVLHQVSDEEKLACLRTTETMSRLLQPFMEESLSQLTTRRDYWLTHMDAERSDAPWQGLRELTLPFLKSGEVLDEVIARQMSRDLMQSRKDAVNRVLETSPYVFLAGLSGVGKTTFVKEELKQPGERLFVEEAELETWASCKTPGRKLLFIDEANLSENNWSLFEGLFSTSPRILVGNKLYDLSPEHRVIFAGNPVNYGSGRTLSPFFERHGQAVVFEPLPSAVVYDIILKPLFENTSLMSFESHQMLVKPILSLYEALCAYSTTDVLISPRELQTMVLLTLQYHATHPDEDLAHISKHYAYQVAKSAVPDHIRATFDDAFKPTLVEQLHREIITLPRTPGSLPFLIPPSRQLTAQHLTDLLELREQRRVHPGNKAQTYGGLGGIVLEGPPGVGKSELVVAMLRDRGYQKSGENERFPASDKVFYQLLASASLPEKEAMLRQAFHEGAVVIVDEINSSPMLEHLLNSLLMGETPEGEPPRHPGFLLIGTQNPATLPGRYAKSTASNRRMLTDMVDEYPLEDMQAILRTRGVLPDVASRVLQAYEQTVASAQNPDSKPTFRDLLRKTNQHVRAHQRAIEHHLLREHPSIDMPPLADWIAAFNAKFANLPEIRDYLDAIQSPLFKKASEQVKYLYLSDVLLQLTSKQRDRELSAHVGAGFFGEGVKSSEQVVYNQLMSAQHSGCTLNDRLVCMRALVLGDEPHHEASSALFF